LGGGKRVRSPGPAGALAWVEPVYAAVSSDIKKGSRLIVKSVDGRSWMIEERKLKKKNLYQTGLAPVEQKASISDNK
jgi:hypothetical protein